MPFKNNPEYNRDHFFFQRQQSLATRDLEWEERLAAPTPYSTLIVRALGVVIVGTILYLIFVKG